MAEALAEEERSTHGREERGGEGDRGGLRHRHDGEAIEEADQAQDLDRGSGDVKAHALRGECDPPGPDEPWQQEQEPEQVAEEDQDEGARPPG